MNELTNAQSLSKPLEIVEQIRFARHRTADRYCPRHRVPIGQLGERVQKVLVTLPLRQDGRHAHDQMIVGPTPFPTHATSVSSPAGEARHIDTVVANDHTIVSHSCRNHVIADSA